MRQPRTNQEFRNPSSAYNQRAMTLIELIIAMVIMSVVSVGSYSMFELVQTAKERLSFHSDNLSSLQKGLNWLSKDIAAAVARPIRDQYGSFSNALIGGNGELELTRNAVITLDLDKFESKENLSSRDEADTQTGKSELLRVQYLLEEGELIRRYWPSLDRSESSEPESSKVMKGVSSLEFRYYYIPSEGSGNWFGSWPPENFESSASSQGPGAFDPAAAEEKKRRVLPTVVEINIETEAYGKLTKLVEVAAFWPEGDQIESGESPDKQQDGGNRNGNNSDEDS